MDVIKQRNEMERTIGILSDTHLYGISKHFRQHSEIAFGSCDTIIHAGDLTDLEILEIFHGKEVFAVHGNMCELATREALPESRIISVNGFQIAVCHGTGNRSTIEERLYERFYEADCIVYGHTHQPVVHRRGDVLYVNPGSFQQTGRYGNPGTYAILSVGINGLSADLQTLPLMQ
jgi:putative phosphoesterase